MGTSNVKSFSSWKTIFSILLLCKKRSVKAPALSVRLCFVPSLILGVLILLYCFHPFRLTILLIEVRFMPVIFPFSLGDLWVLGDSSWEHINCSTKFSFSFSREHFDVDFYTSHETYRWLGGYFKSIFKTLEKASNLFDKWKEIGLDTLIVQKPRRSDQHWTFC